MDYFKWKELDKIDETKPFTPKQTKEEIKRETDNFTLDRGVFRYGFEEEARIAVKYLEQKGYHAEMNITDNPLFAPDHESYNVWFSKEELPDNYESGEWLKEESLEEGKKKKSIIKGMGMWQWPNPEKGIEMFNHALGADAVADGSVGAVSACESLTEDKKELSLPHLDALFQTEGFNAPFTWEFEGETETEESPFHFEYRVEGDSLKIYDSNEEFSIDYGEEYGYNIRDKKLDKIEQALKEDGFEDEVLEWENNVIMTIHIPSKLLKESFKINNVFQITVDDEDELNNLRKAFKEHNIDFQVYGEETPYIIELHGENNQTAGDFLNQVADIVKGLNIQIESLLNEAPDKYGLPTDDELDAEANSEMERIKQEYAKKKGDIASKRQSLQGDEAEFAKACEEFNNRNLSKVKQIYADLASGKILSAYVYLEKRYDNESNVKDDVIQYIYYRDKAFEINLYGGENDGASISIGINGDITPLNRKTNLKYWAKALTYISNNFDKCVDAIKDKNERVNKDGHRRFDYLFKNPKLLTAIKDCSNPGHWSHGGRYIIFSYKGKVYNYEDYDSGAYTNDHVHEFRRFNQIGLRYTGWDYDGPVIKEIDPLKAGLTRANSSYTRGLQVEGQIDLTKLDKLSESLDEDNNQYPDFLGYINGTLEELNPEEFVNKVKAQKQSLHTNRIALASEDRYLVYTITCDLMGVSLEDCSVWVDVIEEDWKRRQGLDMDDIESYRFDEEQDRVLMEDCGEDESKWDKAIQTIQEFKDKTLNQLRKRGLKESLEEGVGSIYRDMLANYQEKLNKAERLGNVVFTIETEDDEREFDNWKDAVEYAKSVGVDRIKVSGFGFEGPNGYDNGDYEEYDEQILDLNKEPIAESLEETKEKIRYYYHGPLHRFEKVFRGEWEGYTEAVSEKQAINNLNQKAKKEFGFTPDAKLNIDPQYLEVSVKHPNDDDFNNAPEVAKCEKCGRQLNDSGECPECDLNDESVLDEAHLIGREDREKEMKDKEVKNKIKELASKDVEMGIPLGSDDYVDFQEECKEEGIEATQQLFDFYTDCLVSMASGYDVKQESLKEKYYYKRIKNYTPEVHRGVMDGDPADWDEYIISDLSGEEIDDLGDIWATPNLELCSFEEAKEDFLNKYPDHKGKSEEELKSIMTQEGYEYVPFEQLDYYEEEPSDPYDESLKEDIEKHDELNPKLFDGEELKPEVKETVQKIADTFIQELNEDGIRFTLKDIVLIGSNVSYNYTKDSDLDIHLIADSSGLECPDDLYPLLYSAYRSIFNRNYDITIKGIPAEIYVEMDEPQARSNGIYSINNGWVKKPEPTVIPDLDEDAFDALFSEWNNKYNELIDKESENLSSDIEDFIEDLYDLRKSSIAQDGEYGLGNLVFKEMRNRGYLDNLKELRRQAKGKELSLEKLEESDDALYEAKLNETKSYLIDKYRKYACLDEGEEINEDNLNEWALNRVSAYENYDVNDLKELLLNK